VGEWVPNSTAIFTTRQYEGTLPDYTAEAWGEFFESCGEEMGDFCPYSLTTRLHGIRDKTKLPDAGCRFASYSTSHAIFL